MKTVLSLALLALACVACSSPRVITNYDESTDFATFETYGFPKRLGTDDARYTSLLSQMLKTAVGRELEARGYEPDEEPDLIVNFFVDIDEKIRTSTTPSVAYGYRSYGVYSGYDTTVTQYTEGTLRVDLVDRGRNQLVWEGVVIGRVTDDRRKELQETVDGAVAEVFSEYPFQAGSDVPAEPDS